MCIRHSMCRGKEVCTWSARCILLLFEENIRALEHEFVNCIQHLCMVRRVVEMMSGARDMQTVCRNVCAVVPSIDMDAVIC
jgi:hypothetical protein